jgi:hypothetical protein
VLEWTWLAALPIFALYAVAAFFGRWHDALESGALAASLLAMSGLAGWAKWHTAYEVVVEGDEVRWRGLMGMGRAPLSRLLQVKRQFFTGLVEFNLGGPGSFTIRPAAGLAEFVDRLSAVAPHVQVRLPATMWRSAARRRGLFEETS